MTELPSVLWNAQTAEYY